MPFSFNAPLVSLTCIWSLWLASEVAAFCMWYSWHRVWMMGFLFYKGIFTTSYVCSLPPATSFSLFWSMFFVCFWKTTKLFLKFICWYSRSKLLEYKIRKKTILDLLYFCKKIWNQNWYVFSTKQSISN